MSDKEKVFLEKIEKHKGVIFKISKMYMDDRDNQEDLFQEIIYQAWKSYDHFEGKSEFSTWLYKVAFNTAIVFLKTEKKRKIFHTDGFDSEKVKYEEYNDEDEQNLKVMYDAIHQLSPIDKALIFYYLENFSGKEIAEQMGISEVNVRVKLNRAKARIKELINKN